MASNQDIFKDLFVLELANNHWGSVKRGRKIIEEHGKVVKKHDVKAAIKLQIRDIDNFIHKNFLTKDRSVEGKATDSPGTSSRYIEKTLATRLAEMDFKDLIEHTKKWGMVPMATPFDEASVDVCDRIDVEIIKIGSMNAISWPLVEKIADLGKPTIISNGGTPVEDLDRVVMHFERKGTPLAINHCVSIYPSEDHELELHQIDFLKKRYPKHIIGFSTHEYKDWRTSFLLSYAKGARTFERHIDLDHDDKAVSKYCSLPHQIDEWFGAYHKAKEMLGPEILKQRLITEKEHEYVKSVCRGMYALRDLPKGHKVKRDGLNRDYYLAIPLMPGQISERDFEKDLVLSKDIKKDEPMLH